jgi:hypothetical protein
VLVGVIVGFGVAVFTGVLVAVATTTEVNVAAGV